MSNTLSLDFVLSFCQEKIPGQGEDSYCYSFCDAAGMLGTFDGCGGSGAKKHAFYSGHTEAYIASRLCAGSFFDEFRKEYPSEHTAAWLVKEVFEPRTVQRLRNFAPPADISGFRIKGPSVRTLPSTAAVALMRYEADGSVLVTAIWAGDSRVYIMDSLGLSQMTTDHTTVTDPMETLYEDGILENVFCTDKPVKLWCKTVRMTEPFVVFSATDGCFGYLSTPMEFEGVLLTALQKSECVDAWEKQLRDFLGSIAGDDYTLCLAAYGYGDYENLQQSFAVRYNYLAKNFLLPLSNLPMEDRESRQNLWKPYRVNYMRYIEG